tara:strand:- start:373 stop:594 length:222 start_codon:yes stop_codon:yes gene_type:complete
MIITKKDRNSHLRSKNRFYVAGWVASEFEEDPQVLKSDNVKFMKYHEQYMEGYRDESENSREIKEFKNNLANA